MAGFTTPWVLIFLIIIPIAYIYYQRILSKKKKQAMQFSNLSFIKSALGNPKKTTREKRMVYLSLAIIACIIIGLSNPHIPLKQSKEGVNVILVLDVSGSMQATDYQPNRLEAAKKSAITLVDSLEEKDHAGVVIFESGATTASYLSPFKEKVSEKIKSIQLKQGKTAIGDGLALGIDMATSIPNKKKVVILLSDGVNNAGVISPNEAIQFAKDNSIQVYTVGMGSNTPTVLGYDWYGNPQYAELDESTLKLIAQNTNAKYFKSVDEETLEDVYKNISEEIEREEEETNIKDFFITLALLLFLVQLYFYYGKKRIIS
ncbi:MAG: Ca-activated chloride channel family protein [Patescibacteria group bacterium]|jgi:Ca-activated chloride channel family protein